jgi:pyruvate/2-oxoglutarate dehydrogenase complex dihydrolipoamide dehydrogenase (E3) component
MTVAIAERGRFGGTCVNTGCTPSKTYVASAYAARLAARAAEYGVALGGRVAVDLGKVKARKDAIVEASSRGVENGLRKLERCTIYQGHARFEAPHVVSIGAARIEAERIFINVGGRAVVPKLPGIDGVEVLTNRSILELESLPSHLIVLGGSYVGLEFAQAFRRFGSDVTVIERGPRLVNHEDTDVSDAIREILEAEGVRVLVNGDASSVERQGAGVRVKLRPAGQAQEIEGSHLLVATGRRPNTDDLGLDRAGVETDARGYIVTNDRLETNVPGIWALGDCNGRGAFTHTSYNDFEIVAANLLDGASRRVTDRITAYALYIDPPLGRAGMTEGEARATGQPVLVAKRPMTRVMRAVEKGETLGFMKFVVERESGRLLGAAILGIGGDEAIHSVLDVMYAKAPYALIRNAMHIHPTVSELIPTTLGTLA